MKRSKYSDLPEVRDQRGNVLQVEVEIRWSGGVGCPPTAGVGSGERQAEADVCGLEP